MVYLIQGFFFQNRQWLGLGMSAKGEGVVALFHRGMCRDMFAGIVWEDAAGELVGEMTDRCGKSEISKIALTPDWFRFEKNYDDRIGQPILYTLERWGGVYVGEYSGASTGRGGATCLITEVIETSPLLFSPDLSRK